MAIDLRRVAIDTAQLMHANRVSEEEQARMRLYSQQIGGAAEEHTRAVDDLRGQMFNGHWGITPDADDWAEVSGTNAADFSLMPAVQPVIRAVDLPHWDKVLDGWTEVSSNGPCGKSTCPCGSGRVQA